MKCVFFLQTSNLHPNKQKYKSEKETLYFYHTKKNEACPLFPNFKPASNRTKIQKFFKIIFIRKHIRKTRIFLQKKIE
jgi:hypothetical protein